MFNPRRKQGNEILFTWTRACNTTPWGVAPSLQGYTWLVTGSLVAYISTKVKTDAGQGYLHTILV